MTLAVWREQAEGEETGVGADCGDPDRERDGVCASIPYFH